MMKDRWMLPEKSKKFPDRNVFFKNGSNASPPASRNDEVVARRTSAKW